MSRLVFAGMMPVPGPTCWPSLGVVNGCAAKLRLQMHFKDLLLCLTVGLILCLCVAMCGCVCVCRGVYLETQETVECPEAGVTCY